MGMTLDDLIEELNEIQDRVRYWRQCSGGDSLEAQKLTQLADELLEAALEIKDSKKAPK